jgi:RecJ-like exonuclease
VQGEVVEYQGGIRLKITTQDDIINLGVAKDLIEPITLPIDEIDDNLLGSLVAIEGELVEIKSSAWWLDDKSGEIKIYLKRNTQIDKDSFKLGDKVRVTGIVDKYGGELRILPRWIDDIQLIGRIEGASQAGNYKALLDDQSQNTKQVSWLKYALAVLVAGVIVLISIIIKLKNKITH